MGIIKHIIKLPFRAMGYNIVRQPRSHYTWLRELGVRTVLDIGANVGHYAVAMRKILPKAQIYSFEPLGDCFKELNENMKRDLYFKAFRCALGDKPSQALINRNVHTPASSLLEMSDLHRRHFSYAVVSEGETIRIERLDDIAAGLDLEAPVMIKIDVQGFEDKVIAGGIETIRRTKILIVETSFEVLYEGQPLFDTIFEMLKELDFTYRGSDHQVRSATDRRVLQQNSVFIRLDA